jgi:uncharacterized membrane protein YkoI
MLRLTYRQERRCHENNGQESAVAVATVAALGLGGAGIALAAGGSSGSEAPSGSSGGTARAAAPAHSRLDDGRDLLPQAKVSEEEATAAAHRAARGGLNEVDLEHYNGRLVWNVGVGSSDVKVDAATGDVLAIPNDELSAHARRGRPSGRPSPSVVRPPPRRAGQG